MGVAVMEAVVVMVVAVEEVATVVVVMGDMEEGVEVEEDTEEVAMVDMAVVAIRQVLRKPMQLVILYSSNLTSIYNYWVLKFGYKHGVATLSVRCAASWIIFL